LASGTLFFARAAAEAQYWPSGGSGAHQNGEDSFGFAQDPRDTDMSFFGFSARRALTGKRSGTHPHRQLRRVRPP
jgi:hypothetical protein